jgi:hypothetical protein
MGETPWVNARVKLWEYLTRGRRKYVFYPVFVLFLAVGILSAFFDGADKICDLYVEWFRCGKDEFHPPDEDVLEEWVLVVGVFKSQEAANADRERFVEAMFRDLIKPHLPPNANPGKISVVRDPEHCGRWFEVLDLVPGDGSEEMQRTWRDSLNRLGPVDPGSEMSQWIRRSKPYYYSRQTYERTYGKIEDLLPEQSPAKSRQNR